MRQWTLILALASILAVSVAWWIFLIWAVWSFLPLPIAVVADGLLVTAAGGMALMGVRALADAVKESASGWKDGKQP